MTWCRNVVVGGGVQVVKKSAQHLKFLSDVGKHWVSVLTHLLSFIPLTFFSSLILPLSPSLPEWPFFPGVLIGARGWEHFPFIIAALLTFSSHVKLTPFFCSVESRSGRFCATEHCLYQGPHAPDILLRQGEHDLYSGSLSALYVCQLYNTECNLR